MESRGSTPMESLGCGHDELINVAYAQGRYLSDITLGEVLHYVHLPSHAASKELGLGTRKPFVSTVVE